MQNSKKLYGLTDCYICGAPATDRHHMLHGRMRKKADQYGLIVPLCRTCHMLLHDHGDYDKQLQKDAQRMFEQTHTRAEFIKEFGKSFL